MDLLDKYPITVVIPTRNSMPELKAHIDSLNGWLHRVRQVVVVDSESTDGTAEYLREHLKHDCVEFLNHPPGLYQSWNAAIKLVLSEYTYIATVNDFMPFETLAQLYSEANRLAADVVVSAP
ncbi:MAG: glycosyltransferase, partial [Opitutae bacterium]|nr:glycosyltransferase [Opitutae bacterium]